MTSTTPTAYFTTMPSPIGQLLITGNDRGITGVHMDASEPPADHVRDDDRFTEVRRQLEAYFRGKLMAFDLPLAAAGTGFQCSVWNALQAIPYGMTASYGEVARQIGNDRASRAVGLANGRNPISIIVPCHRVIGANGSLTGYAGGVDRKQWLLAHERRHRDAARGSQA